MYPSKGWWSCELFLVIPQVTFTFLTGKLENTGEITEKEIIRAERNSGVVSNRVREIQVRVMMLELQTITL